MLGRRRRATSTQCRSDVGPTSHGRYRPNVGPTHVPLYFFSLHNLPERLCAEIVPMLEAAINSGPVLAWLQTYFYTCMKSWFIFTHWGPDKMDAIFPDDIFKCIFLNARIWISIKFSLKFVCMVQLTIYTSVGSNNGLAPASDKPLSFCTLCLDQSVHLRNRTVTSLDMWILHWRRSHWCLKSPVTQLDCLFNRLFWQTSTPAFLALCEGNPPVTDGFPSQKASNAASIGPMLVQRWHTAIGATLAQR